VGAVFSAVAWDAALALALRPLLDAETYSVLGGVASSVLGRLHPEDPETVP
jgi:hypothetical protein